MLHRACTGLAVLVLMTSFAMADEAKSPEKTEKIKRPQTPYAVLYEQWKAEVTALDEVIPKLSAAEKSERRTWINAQWTPRFVALAKEHPDDALWIDCLIWTTAAGEPGLSSLTGWTNS